MYVVRVGFVVVSFLLVACTGERVQRASLASLAPPSAGWLVFCAEHGGGCDPVPSATPMRDGEAATAPEPWRAFCRRHAGDSACAR